MTGVWRAHSCAPRSHSCERESFAGEASQTLYMQSRRLSHIYPPHRWLFVTWRLYGSLPRAQYPPPGKVSAGKAFVWMDRCLDLARSGPVLLSQPDIAELVVESVFKGVDLRHYELGSSEHNFRRL